MSERGEATDVTERIDLPEAGGDRSVVEEGPRLVVRESRDDVERELVFDVRDVSVYYGAFRAVRGVSLEVPRNKITALIGPSGSGKSTLLRSFNRMNDLIETARLDGRILYHGVDIYADAPVYASPTSTAQTGTLYKGTDYVFCKAWGRMIGTSTTYNHWWLRTDPDVGPAGQYVSAYYLSRWGNDEAKDNNGTVIPDC